MSWGLRSMIRDLEDEVRRLEEMNEDLRADLEVDTHVISALEKENKRLNALLEEVADFFDTAVDYQGDSVLSLYNAETWSDKLHAALDKYKEP